MPRTARFAADLDALDADLALLPGNATEERAVLTEIHDAELLGSLTGPTDPHAFLGEEF